MKNNKLSLRTRAIILVTLFLLVSYALLGTMLIRQTRNVTKTRINEHMLDIVNTAAAMLDGDILDRLRADDRGTPEYEQVMDILVRFRDNINLDYIYYVRDEGDGRFTFGFDTDPDRPAVFGAPVVYTDALFEASHGQPAVDHVPYTDEWGRFYSAYCPVFDSQRKVAGIVTADFSAAWYEQQIDQIQFSIIFGCMLFIAVGIAATVFLSRQYKRQTESMRKNLSELAMDLDSLTQEFAEEEGMKAVPEPYSDDIQSLGKHISDLKNSLRFYVTHANTLANSMITAMASDYRCVYYVNLDENNGVCYRNDPDDHEQTPAGVHFPYLERFTWYAEHSVTEKYRDGFLRFIDPDNVRAALAGEPIIAYRYLARRDGREYYEMIRMAGVRRAEDRDDHTVHSVGLGFTVIDAEMRETMAKNEALAVLHGTLDFRRAIDVPGYSRIPLSGATRFIGTMNYGYAGTRELNEALASRFMIIQMPVISKENLKKLIRQKFPTIKEDFAEQFAELFAEIRRKCEGGEVSTKSLDLRGLLSAIELTKRGLPAVRALNLGIVNKCFDEYERQLISDMVTVRFPGDFCAEKIFS